MRDTWKQRLQERPDRPQGRQHRQFDVLAVLADLLDADTGEGAVTMAELAKTSNTSERTIRRAIGWAVASGLLRRTSRGHRLGDGTTVPSSWLLLDPQPANSTPQPVSSQPQPANPVSQPAKSPKASRRRPAQPARCRVCCQPLDPAVAANGIHPTCEPDDAPDPLAPRRPVSPETVARGVALARAALEGKSP